MLAISQCHLNEACVKSPLEDDVGLIETLKRKNLNASEPLDGSANGTAVGTRRFLRTKKLKGSNHYQSSDHKPASSPDPRSDAGGGGLGLYKRIPSTHAFLRDNDIILAMSDDKVDDNNGYDDT